jgi:hypothetical protein
LGTISRLIARAAAVVALSGVVVGDAPAVPELPGVLDGQMFADLPVGGVALPPVLPNALRPPAVSPPISGRGGADPVEHAAPARLVIVRTRAIDFVSDGVVVHRVAGDGRAVSLATLAAAAPRSWITIAGDTARLGAAVQLTAGTRLDVDGVRTLQLVGGNDPRASAFLATGRGQIRLRGVTVTSTDPTSGQPVAVTAAGRPSIRVSDGGSLIATDSSFTDLGTLAVGAVSGVPAVSFGRRGTGVLTRTTLARSSTGLALIASQGVHLQDVTVTGSSDNGIVLRGDRDTVLSGVRAERNGDNGVLVVGEAAARPITGITTTGNRSYGVSIAGQSHADISNLVLVGDQAGGLELVGVSDSHVHHVATSDEPVGVLMRGNSANLALDTIAVSGGRSGVVAEKTTVGMRFTDSTITNAHVVGLAYDGRDGLLAGLTITDNVTAVRVERGSGALTIDKLRVIGGEDGLVASRDTASVLVTDVSAHGVSNDAIRTDSPGMQIVGGQIRGGHTGLDLRAATTVTGIQVGRASTGIRAAATAAVILDKVTIDAETVGVAAERGSAVSLNNSSVHAPHATRGDVHLTGVNDLSQPLNLLGVIGLPLLLLALVLEFLHLLRQLQHQRAGSRESLRRWHAMATTEPTSPSTVATTCAACGSRAIPATASQTALDANTVRTCEACIAA